MLKLEIGDWNGWRKPGFQKSLSGFKIAKSGCQKPFTRPGIAILDLQIAKSAPDIAKSGSDIPLPAPDIVMSDFQIPCFASDIAKSDLEITKSEPDFVMSELQKRLSKIEIALSVSRFPDGLSNFSARKNANKRAVKNAGNFPPQTRRKKFGATD